MSGMEAAPCGCKFGVDEQTKTFLFEPCAIDCELYAYVRAENDKQSKPAVVLDVRDEGGPCRWFALCPNMATGILRHPILGNVPICERCREKDAALRGEP